MPIKGAGEILADEIRSAINALTACVVPIFQVNEQREAVLLGSAVLIELADETWLCSAKHVIDENIASTLYIDGLTQLVILVGDFYGSIEHDVAVMKLTTEQIASLRKYDPICTKDIANQAQTSTCKYAEFVGFPSAKNKKIYRKNKINREIYAIGGMILETTDAKIRLSFDRNKNIDAKSHKRVMSPDPHGMSGGAIFGVPVDEATIEGNPHPKLIGISTDWPSPSKEVFGSSIAIVLAIIRDAWQIVLPPRLNLLNIKASISVTSVSASEATI